MKQALVAAIVGVDEPGVELRRQASHGETMVLRGDVAALRAMQLTRLVLAAMSKLEFVGVATGRQRQHLVAQADAQRGNAPLQGLRIVRMVAWTIFGLPGPFETTMPSNGRSEPFAKRS